MKTRLPGMSLPSASAKLARVGTPLPKVGDRIRGLPPPRAAFESMVKKPSASKLRGAPEDHTVKTRAAAPAQLRQVVEPVLALGGDRRRPLSRAHQPCGAFEDAEKHESDETAEREPTEKRDHNGFIRRPIPLRPHSGHGSWDCARQVLHGELAEKSEGRSVQCHRNWRTFA